MVVCAKLKFIINNTKFIDVFSQNGFLVYVQNHIVIDNSKFSNTSLLFKGSGCKYDISNSLFENYFFSSSKPAIIDARSAKINVSNTEFRNFKLMDGLFYEESKVNLQNIKLRDISTNGKGLINTFYNDLIINGLYAKNVTCYGDEGDSSIILFIPFILGFS